MCSKDRRNSRRLKIVGFPVSAFCVFFASHVHSIHPFEGSVSVFWLMLSESTTQFFRVRLDPIQLVRLVSILEVCVVSRDIFWSPQKGWPKTPVEDVFFSAFVCLFFHKDGAVKLETFRIWFDKRGKKWMALPFEVIPNMWIALKARLLKVFCKAFFWSIEFNRSLN